MSHLVAVKVARHFRRLLSNLDQRRGGNLFVFCPLKQTEEREGGREREQVEVERMEPASGKVNLAPNETTVTAIQIHEGALPVRPPKSPTSAARCL